LALLMAVDHLLARAAGIPKEDERGRTVDLQALRDTFGTHLSKNGVAPRTAQAALRHSSLNLTMNSYTDPDERGFQEKVPAHSAVLTHGSVLRSLPQLSLTGSLRAVHSHMGS